MICKECEDCWNYLVSEVGCYGSSTPCKHFISDDIASEEQDKYESKYDDEFELF